MALATGAVCAWAWRQPLQANQPIPRPVRVSFMLFAVLLVIAGWALVTRQPHIFPWPLDANSTVIFGWVFLGAAVYFLYVLAEPYWKMAQGQLIGFLAYDLVLIGPFLAHFASVLPEHRLSLIVYTSVLIYSGGLAIYYLFLNAATRLKRP